MLPSAGLLDGPALPMEFRSPKPCPQSGVYLARLPLSSATPPPFPVRSSRGLAVGSPFLSTKLGSSGARVCAKLSRRPPGGWEQLLPSEEDKSILGGISISTTRHLLSPDSSVSFAPHPHHSSLSFFRGWRTPSRQGVWGHLKARCRKGRLPSFPKKPAPAGKWGSAPLEAAVHQGLGRAPFLAPCAGLSYARLRVGLSLVRQSTTLAGAPVRPRLLGGGA